MESSTDFGALIARLRNGDGEAANELLNRYEDAVRRYIRVRLTDPGLKRQMDSIDICQSVMADFFVRSALGQFDLKTPEQLIALLATMARNRLLNHVKKQRAQRRDVRRLEAFDVIDAQPAATVDTPSQIAAGREMLDEFRGRLTTEERQLADRRARGDAWVDIARELGGSPDALRVRLARAVERVADELGLDSSRYD
jgi:RNA polymerase sigma factor (sigma-70 family)